MAVHAILCVGLRLYWKCNSHKLSVAREGNYMIGALIPLNKQKVLTSFSK